MTLDVMLLYGSYVTSRLHHLPIHHIKSSQLFFPLPFRDKSFQETACVGSFWLISVFIAVNIIIFRYRLNKRN